MADLPRIKSKDTVEVPAVAAKTFGDRFIVGMGIGFDESTGVQPMQVALQAYNFDTKEMSSDPNTVSRFKLPNIWSEATRSPTFAAAMSGMINCLMLLYHESSLIEQLTNMEESAERIELASQLKTVQSDLGVPDAPIPPLVLSELIWAAPLVDGEPPPE